MLTLHAGRLGALLLWIRLVDNQHSLFATEVLLDTNVLLDVVLQVVSYGLRVPLGRIQQALDTVGHGLAERLGELPAVLALYR